MLLLKVSSINLFGNWRLVEIPLMNIYKSNRDSTPVFVGKTNVKTLKKPQNDLKHPKILRINL
jgi:hypothetical protein